MRLALFSPLNPVPSGISDYTEELLPLLASQFEITLVVDNFVPTNPALAPFKKITSAELKARPSDFDLILYHMGNSPAHDEIYRTLLDCPGVVVMHDLVLHHLRAWQTIERGDPQAYVAAMDSAYGNAGRELAEREVLGTANLNRFDFPLNTDVVRAARALIVHSEYAARSLQSLAPTTPLAVIPMSIAPQAMIPGDAARERLGLPQGAFIVAAFGEVHPFKRVTVELEAFAEFHAHCLESLFVLVGSESPNYDVGGLIEELKLDNAMRRAGFAAAEEYRDYIAAADLCLNLRYPSAGETSASLLRLFAAGKPVIVTRTAAYAELPDDVCAKLEPDAFEQTLLVEYLDYFAGRPQAGAALGANAREYVMRHHTPEQAAAAYADFLRTVAEGHAVSKSYLG